MRDGETVIVRDGYHPFVATHGDDAYYLNALAGDVRTMACSFDPALDHGVRTPGSDGAGSEGATRPLSALRAVGGWFELPGGTRHRIYHKRHNG